MASVTPLAVSATSRGTWPDSNGTGAGTTDGPAAMAICNAITVALKQSCGKGPTKVKAYSTHDEVAVVVQDMLTTLEKTLSKTGTINWSVMRDRCSSGAWPTRAA